MQFVSFMEQGSIHNSLDGEVPDFESVTVNFEDDKLPPGTVLHIPKIASGANALPEMQQRSLSRKNLLDQYNN